MILFDYSVWVVMIACGLLGLSSGVLSCFAVLREQSLYGDAIAHASLPGICLAFLIYPQKNPLILLLGALLVGLLASYVIYQITEKSALKSDTALALVMSVFFGFGLMLLTYIQKMPTASQSGLEQYLFGYTAGLLMSDIYVMASMSTLLLLSVALFYKEFKLLSFDINYAASLGLPVKRLNLLLLFLLVVAIVIGLQLVGVVLMSAMIIAPAAAARQWVKSLAPMLCLSVFIAVFSALLGVLISSGFDHVPTGPCIVLCLSAVAFFSLLFATERGYFVLWGRRQWQRYHLSEAKILQQLQLLARSHPDPLYAHPVESLTLFKPRPTLAALEKLQEKGLVHSPKTAHWGLSQKGIKHLGQTDDS
eukprot:COSAG01_NODE_547_length_15635_cov_102.896498_10_plen_364_part_00